MQDLNLFWRLVIILQTVVLVLVAVLLISVADRQRGQVNRENTQREVIGDQARRISDLQDQGSILNYQARILAARTVNLERRVGQLRLACQDALVLVTRSKGVLGLPRKPKGVRC